MLKRRQSVRRDPNHAKAHPQLEQCLVAHDAKFKENNRYFATLEQSADAGPALV